MNQFQKIANKEDYKSQLEKTHFKTFFHASEWEDFLEKEFSWLKFERYIWKDELLLSIARCKLFGKEKLVSHPFCEYGGPLPRHSGLRPREGGPLPLKEDIDLESFARDFRLEFGDRGRIKFHPYLRRAGDCSPAHSRPPGRQACEVRPGQSMLHQASNPPGNNPQPSLASFWIKDFSRKTREDLWGSFRKTLRQEIKKGDKCSVDISECESEGELKQFYNLYVRTTKRHKNIPLPFSIFGMFNEHTNERSSEHTKIILAKKNDRVIGGSVFLFYKPFIHYFINASDSKYRDWNVGHNILWNVMQKYVGKEYDYFDLGGTRKGSPLEVFKRGWGADEFPIYEIGATKNAESGSWKRRAWGMLPAFLMRRIANRALYFKV